MERAFFFFNEGVQGAVDTDWIDEKISWFSLSHFLVNMVEDVQMTE